MTKRIYECYIAPQFGGKTYTIKKRIRELRTRRGIKCIFVFDRLGEYTNDGEVVKSFGHYIEVARDGIPRVVVCQCGLAVSDYDLFFDEIINLGNCMLILDEGYKWAPQSTKWSGNPDLENIVYAGRHLRNFDGRLAPTHLIVGAQYPKTMYHGLWSQASVIRVGSIGEVQGEHTRNWVKENFGKPHLEKVDNLKKWKFHTVRGAPK